MTMSLAGSGLQARQRYGSLLSVQRDYELNQARNPKNPGARSRAISMIATAGFRCGRTALMIPAKAQQAKRRLRRFRQIGCPDRTLSGAIKRLRPTDLSHS